MATSGFDWSCSCGKVRMKVTPGRSREMTCYCNHCRHFAEEFGEEDTLDAGGGVAIAMMTNERVEVLEGADQLVALKYTEKGPLRWYTRCCRTPVGMTAGVAKTTFLGLHAARLQPGDALGPPLACAHTKSATGPVTKAAGFMPVVFAGFMADVLGAKLSGRWKTSPFFKGDGTPISAPDMRPWSPGA